MVLNPVISKLGGKLVVLASASPRRREILTNVGLRFEVVPSWFKETLEKSLFKAPYEYAVETAKQKALEVARRMPFKHLKTPDIVIGADTVVTVDGYILEKPVDKEDAYRMLSRLSGKEHSVFTGVAIVHCNSELGKEVEYDVVDFYEETKVKFADLSEDMLWEYIHSGEPMDKAGGYGIQALGGMLVEYVHGDFLNVTLFTASKLKVFDLLVSPGGLTVAEMAVQIPASVIGTERLLDSVVSLGLLEKSHLGESIVYKNTEEANQYLVSSSNCSLHGYIIYCNDRIWPLFTHLEDAVQEGTNQFERAFGKKSSELSRDSCLSDKEMKLQFMNAMHSIATVTGADIAAAFDLSPFKTACDLGGCTGAMACQFTKLYPSLSVTIFDLPAVVEMRSHFCTQSEDLSRVTFAAGDFFKDDLPKADLYILARILHDLTDDKINILLSRLSQMCSPGCGLLVAEIFLDEEQRTPSRALLQALSMSDGRQRSASQYSQILKKYGFNEICVKHTGNFLDAILCVKQ
ncbi:putative bifunctional dTTP/UTP pyrophosphatase/methyltransferase protein isoform X2 [Amia ocellicauda]|uniref:putative bifunctional dTTP/UTP pyrophosphatase/methyltransferase protein isoform X2 n=1 Tax=Amia ocellicauda TaxID=2972642 RepID=UPI003464B442